MSTHDARDAAIVRANNRPTVPSHIVLAAIDEYLAHMALIAERFDAKAAALADAEQRLAAAEQRVAELDDAMTRLAVERQAFRDALYAYVRAHGNVAQLSNDMVEVEMFKCFLRAVSVLGIVAKPPTPTATVTREGA